jgi:selenocysteine lyase/cysteine desulfurase
VIEHSRRSFVSSSLAAFGGSSLLSLVPATATDLSASPSGRDDESYWRLVAHQFSLEPGLHYFNNASLGPSPRYVADATETYRRTLDAFPSRYMWGGWDTEKESVRTMAAELLGAGAEEIALIHNTTEGMNLVASSLDLEAGDEVVVADHEHPSGTIPWQRCAS